MIHLSGIFMSNPLDQLLVRSETLKSNSTDSHNDEAVKFSATLARLQCPFTASALLKPLTGTTKQPRS